MVYRSFVISTLATPSTPNSGPLLYGKASSDIRLAIEKLKGRNSKLKLFSKFFSVRFIEIYLYKIYREYVMFSRFFDNSKHSLHYIATKKELSLTLDCLPFTESRRSPESLGVSRHVVRH